MKSKMIIDSHIHYSYPSSKESLEEALNIENATFGALVSQVSKTYASETIDCLFMKSLLENKLYCFGSLDATCYINRTNMSEKLINHVKNLLKIGCEGIKMIEGKPQMRKELPVPDFDDPIWNDFFSFMEKEQINIIFHVNDPEEFWDLDKIPSWAKASNWYYDQTFIKYEESLRQIIARLKLNPNLKITFAHFLFLSNQLDLLQELFDKYPNICVDITPGVELFINLSKNPQARDFFIKNQDRIIYGTDISRMREDTNEEFNIQDAKNRSILCYDFLVKDELIIP